ncbi:MAG TPA: hypothetical protein VF621_08180, partial [Pyrinomonadaceae bacterium]
DADLAGAMGVLDAGDEMGGAGRTQLATFIEDHETNIWGATAIGDAVQASQSLLNDSSGYDFEAMCVLTDGNETASLYLDELDPDELHSRIYAIGVGTPENINPSALATIAGSNDGYLLMTGNITANDTFLLTKYFQQILAGVTNTEITVDPQGWLTPGQTLRLPFPVNETDRQVDAIVHCQYPWLLRFEIESPDGQVFGPAQASVPEARYVVGAGSAYYRLDIPSTVVGPQDPARPWYALISLDDKRWFDMLSKVRDPRRNSAVAGAAVNGMRYAFTAQARSALRMDVKVTQNSLEPGATALISATILEYGYPLTAPARVWAVVTDPQGTARDVPLQPAGNSVYQASLTAGLTGAWRVTVHAQGQTSIKSPFTRETIRTIAVWPGGDRPVRRPPHHDCRGWFCCLCPCWRRFLSCLRRRKKLKQFRPRRAARQTP